MKEEITRWAKSLISLKGNVKFGPLFIAVLLFFIILFISTPESLINLVKKQDPLGYHLQYGTRTITESMSRIHEKDFSPEEVGYKAKIMVAILLLAAFLWATEAIPIGATDLLVGGLLYIFGILPVDQIPKAYMKDAVFFIFGVLALAVGVSKTGLDNRIGIMLLGKIKSIESLCFVFFPIISIIAGFLSGHALMAILLPVLLSVYHSACKLYDVKCDRSLAILLVLGVCFSLNQGGPGSPAAGGRNAIMVGYLEDFGKPILFRQWLIYSMPYVLIISFITGVYMYITFKRKLRVPTVNFSKFIHKETDELGSISVDEIIMTVIMLGVILAWITASSKLGMGGTCIIGVALMLISGIVKWADLQKKVRFDVVGLYAAACAMGVALKSTGASLWIANLLIKILPSWFRQGNMLIVAVSAITMILTNFMSDGATVAAMGPIALAMSEVSGIHIWKVGLACAFSSSFANMLIIGTPNNAIAYIGATDPETGEKLLKIKDFAIYGIPITIIACLVLWFWGVFGYWKWLPWL
ncbi:DASS family sodium-coupled anion symporter [Candidatus Poribacteria bacterium]|nr:DASS family sodium-coupled anion symporter [Candidatus Poribacteria bacterium]